MKFSLAALALLLSFIPSLAQDPSSLSAPVLRLKSGRTPPNLLTLDPAPSALERGLLSSRRADPSRAHLLLQFPAGTLPEALPLLEQRGFRVLRYVPDEAVIVSSIEPADLSELNLVFAGSLEPEDKLSALFSNEPAGPPQAAVVEFHDDVEPAQARSIALSEGIELLDNPDLAPAHLLIRATYEQLAALAAFDEVTYLFPAADDLVQSLPVIACLGGSAGSLGAAANLATAFGDGWDGPGLGAAALTYWLGPMAPRLDLSSTRAEVERALAAWSAVAQVRFTRTSSASLGRSLDILFAQGQHGDSYPFDGSGGVLAHTYYPPPNAEPLAGDLHLDAGENWRIGADVDVFSVALHELGHSLGLGHNDNANSVMYPYYRRVSGLRPADIDEIRRLYASAGSAPEPAPPSPPVTPSPQPPVTPPSPPATPPAVPPAPGPDRAAPVLTILYPGLSLISTAAREIVVRGIATDNVGVKEISWSASNGTSGIATGLPSFSTTPIRLSLGINSIRVAARDEAGNQTLKILLVTRK